MKLSTAFAAVALSAAAALPAMAAPNLLINGGFESTVLANGSWANVGSVAGWSWLAGPGTGFEVRNNVEGVAQEGRNFIELDTNGNTTIGQYLDNLGAGSELDLSFWYAPRRNVAASSNGIQVFWNGVLLDSTITGLGTNQDVWSQHQYRVTAQAGRNLLSFASVGTSDSLGGNLDNVSLNRVPEPGSLALTAAALAGAFLLPRRLRRAAQERRAKALASTLGR
ncbi:PEP-CTERM sorting domain-containing protein [Roseateles sp. BYS87W]|uniref:PEP-CTERM sorting domain-containing protein n=1 Tax=Pelomonas baiyunensis TaxID=3299026 RepID=A0ABW7H016_9BURK